MGVFYTSNQYHMTDNLAVIFPIEISKHISAQTNPDDLYL